LEQAVLWRLLEMGQRFRPYDAEALRFYREKASPDGHFKFLHPWPGQIPPGQDGEECLSVG
jgi:hypothetical protein